MTIRKKSIAFVLGPVFLSPGDHMVFGRNEGGSSRHRQSIKGGPKKIHFQLAVNEQGVCVRLCVCMCVCVGGGVLKKEYCRA